ncbi:MAG: GntR family transcriptional regulator [Clostridia bacterium]|nr:GntR family transcriptional regulator [Clostridia bacterium]
MPSGQSFLYQNVTQYLAQLIAKNLSDPHYKLPAELEIAKAQGVSRITVRKAFKELCDLNLLVRSRGKGTYINEHVTYEMLKPFLPQTSQKHKTKIALILPLPPTNSQHLVEIFSAVLEATADLNLLVSSSNMSLTREQNLISSYLEMNVDGILLYPIDNDIYNPTLIQLAATNFPIVLIDRYLPGLDFAYIASDHKTAISSAVTHLLERGHEHILFFNANTKTNTALTLRQEGYTATLNEYDNYNNYFFTFNGDSDHTSKSFCEKFRQYLNINKQLTAIIAADYASGLHLQQIAKELQLTDEHYEIVFLDVNTIEPPYSHLITHPTFIEQNSWRLGETAVKMLKSALAGKNIRNTNQLIPVNLLTGNAQ